MLSLAGHNVHSGRLEFPRAAGSYKQTVYLMGAVGPFEEFVKRQLRHAADDKAVDWNKEKNNWLIQLQKLYDRIAEYLEEYIETGAIQLRESIVGLNEEHIGAYDAKRLTIVIGAQEIRLNPVGLLLIGSKGRVDVEGSAGNSRLLLMDKDLSDPRQMVRAAVAAAFEGGEPSASKKRSAPKNIDLVWKIASRPPTTQFIELNKETFLEMLMEVSNG